MAARTGSGEGDTARGAVQEAERFAFYSGSCVIPLHLFSGLAAIPIRPDPNVHPSVDGCATSQI